MEEIKKEFEEFKKVATKLGYDMSNYQLEDYLKDRYKGNEYYERNMKRH